MNIIKRSIIIGSCLSVGLFLSINASTDEMPIKLLTAQSTLAELFDHPKLKEFADKLLPWDGGEYDHRMTLARVGELMPYHSHFNVADMLMPLNLMILSTEPVFYDFYEGKVSHTGLFLLRGKPNMPTAIIAAGGAFQYVGSLHEAFPLAHKITEKGYNAVVVKYRSGVNVQYATEDLASSIDYLFKNQKKLKINMMQYSLWGASASARMVAYVGSYGVQSFGVHNPEVPRPQAVIMLYTGHSDVSNNEPPTPISIINLANPANPILVIQLF